MVRLANKLFIFMKVYPLHSVEKKNLASVVKGFGTNWRFVFSDKSRKGKMNMILFNIVLPT